MSKWIDADALMNQWCDEMCKPKPSCEEDCAIYDYVRLAPSIDIVRCQDCKYWVYNFNGCKRNPCTEPWYATDGCTYGERDE